VDVSECFTCSFKSAGSDKYFIIFGWSKQGKEGKAKRVGPFARMKVTQCDEHGQVLVKSCHKRGEDCLPRTLIEFLEVTAHFVQLIIIRHRVCRVFAMEGLSKKACTKNLCC
jgi:hypothetical protein